MSGDDAMDVEASLSHGSPFMDVDSRQSPPSSHPAHQPQRQPQQQSNRQHSSQQPPQQPTQCATPQSTIDQVIADTRHIVVSFLRERSAEDIVPINSRVVIIDAAVRLRHAFRALFDNGMFALI